MTPLYTVGLALAGLLVGVSTTIQPVVNASLGQTLASPLWAAFANFAIGTALLAVILIATREPVPALQAVARAPWYAWLGGLLGVVYVLGGILLVPRLGVATVVALFIGGQMLSSVAFDHFGLLGLAVREASLPRIAGAALLVLGAALISLF